MERKWEEKIWEKNLGGKGEIEINLKPEKKIWENFGEKKSKIWEDISPPKKYRIWKYKIFGVSS